LQFGLLRHLDCQERPLAWISSFSDRLRHHFWQLSSFLG
jgi:hypothetical protein